MILEGLVAALLYIVDFLLGFLPDLTGFTSSGGELFSQLISLGLYFSGTLPFIAILSSVIFWVGVQFGWRIPVWIYEHIPILGKG